MMQIEYLIRQRGHTSPRQISAGSLAISHTFFEAMLCGQYCGRVFRLLDNFSVFLFFPKSKRLAQLKELGHGSCILKS